MTIHWKAVEQYFTVVLSVFKFTQFVILENLSVMDLALSGVTGISPRIHIHIITVQAPGLGWCFTVFSSV